EARGPAPRILPLASRHPALPRALAPRCPRPRGPDHALAPDRGDQPGPGRPARDPRDPHGAELLSGGGPPAPGRVVPESHHRRVSRALQEQRRRWAVVRFSLLSTVLVLSLGLV